MTNAHEILKLIDKMREILFDEIDSKPLFKAGDIVKIITPIEGQVDELVLKLKCSHSIGEIIRKETNGYIVAFTIEERITGAGWFHTGKELSLFKNSNEVTK